MSVGQAVALGRAEPCHGGTCVSGSWPSGQHGPVPAPTWDTLPPWPPDTAVSMAFQGSSDQSKLQQREGTRVRAGEQLDEDTEAQRGAQSFAQAWL